MCYRFVLNFNTRRLSDIKLEYEFLGSPTASLLKTSLSIMQPLGNIPRVIRKCFSKLMSLYVMALDHTPSTAVVSSGLSEALVRCSCSSLRLKTEPIPIWDR